MKDENFELEPGFEELPELRERGLRQDVEQQTTEFLEPEADPVFDFRYTLSEQEYIDFNLMLFERNMAKSRRKTRIFGILEVVISALMFALFFNQDGTSLMIKIMTFVLFFFGVFSLAYYSYLFPKQLKKSVGKTYRESESLKGEFHIRLFDSFVRDTYEGKETDVAFADIAGVLENDQFLLILLNDIQAFILPKRIFEEDTYDKLSDFLYQKCEEYSKKRQRLSKKNGKVGKQPWNR